jgi:hypothetical protein
MASKGTALRAASPFVQWREEYAAVLQETDHNMLFMRVEIAEAALRSRREALMRSSDGLTERREIEKALDRLRTMKREVLIF